jgi:hypothetical protein
MSTANCRERPDDAEVSESPQHRLAEPQVSARPREAV